MSWAEVKKINSDLSTPLNIAALINHIDMIGSSYTGNPSEAVELMKSNALYSHDTAKNVVYGLLETGGATATAMAEYCETKLSASTGVGEWLGLLANSDNATLKACDDMTAVINSSIAMTVVVNSSIAMTVVVNSSIAMTAVINSSIAMTAVINSSTAMTAVIARETAIGLIINSETALYVISQNATALSLLASSIENTTTILWESDTKWQTIYDTLNASTLFTKSGLLHDTGGTKNRSGNLITLINNAYTPNASGYDLSITPAYTGCYVHSYGPNWFTGKHIMWGGHTSVHQKSDTTYCYVKHYMFTPIV